MSAHLNQPQANDLIGLARARFGDLSAAETTLLAAARMGGFALCGPRGNLSDPANDPAKASEWGTERTIRASLIRWLCVEQTARNRVDPNGIRASGAKVLGKLDLSNVTVPFGLTLAGCRLMEDAYLISTSLADLDLRASWVRCLIADRMSVKGGVFLSGGFRAEGEVRFPASQIGIDLSCENSFFTNPSKVALNAGGMNVKGNVFFRQDFQVEGELHLSGAQIGSNLECDGATLKNAVGLESSGSGIALNADRVIVGGYVFLRNGFSAEGEVKLLNAEIGGSLECQGALLKNPSREGAPGSGTALIADGIRVKGNILLTNGFRAEGEVRLRGANIGGVLNCENGTFTNPSKMALDADRIQVAGYVFLRNGFTAEGEVKLLNAEIGSNLECDNAKFKNPPQDGVSGSGRALYADRVKVAGYVFLRNGFSAEGEVNLLNAQIGSDLDCSKGTFDNPEQAKPQGAGIALCMDGASIQGSVFLGEEFKAEGEVRVSGAQIGGQIACVNSRIRAGLIAQATTAAGALFWTKILEPGDTKLDLVNTHVDALVDDRQSWPDGQKLRIDGLVYERFSGSDTPKSARARLDWLSRQKDFAPQPYGQVAKVLRDNGDDAGARRVLSEMERLRRKHEYASRNRFVRFWASTWCCSESRHRVWLPSSEIALVAGRTNRPRDGSLRGRICCR